MTSHALGVAALPRGHFIVSEWWKPRSVRRGERRASQSEMVTAPRGHACDAAADTACFRKQPWPLGARPLRGLTACASAVSQALRGSPTQCLTHGGP